MSQRRIMLAGFFERAPEFDTFPQSGNFLAWRLISTGGIWYGEIDETYEYVEKRKCGSCEGRGRVWDCASEKWPCRFQPAWSGLCWVCGKSEPCRLCDGAGVIYIPTIINRG